MILYDPALDPKGKLVATRKQDLTIQGKKYACEVKQYDLSRGDDKTSATFWHCKEIKVPYRALSSYWRTLAMRPEVLRLDLDFQGNNRSEKMSMRVTDLAEERKIGERNLVCVRQVGEIEMTDGETKGKAKIVILLSNEVPGREIEMIADGEFAGTKIRRVMRIEAFEAIKEK
jgi:hypothetical protein